MLVYLVEEIVRFHQGIICYFFGKDLDVVDPGCTVNNPISELTVFREFHIVYNPAFCVPTLWLRAWNLGMYPFISTIPFSIINHQPPSEMSE